MQVLAEIGPGTAALRPAAPVPRAGWPWVGAAIRAIRSNPITAFPVSYTHLTLPTNREV